MQTKSDSPKLLDDWHATNWMPFVVCESDKGFEIRGKETPMEAIWFHTSVIAAFFIAMDSFIWANGPRKYLWFCAGIGLPTIIGFYFGTVAFHRRQRVLGPLLRFDQLEGNIELPRTKATLQLGELELCAIVCDECSDEPIWQLQLWAKDKRRFPLVTAFTKDELLSMAKTIRNNLAIPLKVYVGDSRKVKGWTEETFE